MGMTAEKKAKLEAAGWKVGSAADFLGLTPEESARVDLLAMADVQAQREEAAAQRTTRPTRAQRKRISSAV